VDYVYVRIISVYSVVCEIASLMRRANRIETYTYFMTVIDGAFCMMGHVCDKQTQDTFQPSRLTGMKL